MKLLATLFSLKGNLFLVSIRLTVYTLIVIAISGCLYELSTRYDGNFYYLKDYYGGVVSMFLVVSLAILLCVFALTYWLKLDEFSYVLLGIQGFWLLFFLYLFLMSFESHSVIICF